jgi:YggT family protein
MLAARTLDSMICLALTTVTLLLLARVILSWLEFFGLRLPATGPVHAGQRFVFVATEWMLRPLRKIAPPTGALDLSVLLAFAIVFVLRVALRC